MLAFTAIYLIEALNQPLMYDSTYKTTVESEGQSHLVDSQHKVRQMTPSEDGIKSRDRYATSPAGKEGKATAGRKIVFCLI